jgi:hypothetical protein
MPETNKDTQLREISKDGAYEARFGPSQQARTTQGALVGLTGAVLIVGYALFFRSVPAEIIPTLILYFGLPLAVVCYFAFRATRDFVVRIADRHVYFSRDIISFGGMTPIKIEAIDGFVVTDLGQRSAVATVVHARYVDGTHQTLTLGTHDREQLEHYAQQLNDALVEGKRRSHGYRG